MTNSNLIYAIFVRKFTLFIVTIFEKYIFSLVNATHIRNDDCNCGATPGTVDAFVREGGVAVLLSMG